MGRWVSQMTAVEIHAIWERYVERRLITALNHGPSFFLVENDIRGVSRISAGFAAYLVRGGRQFFDFRSFAELLQTGDRLLGRDNNPFRVISNRQKQYVDCLAAIRNLVVHRSDAAAKSYRNQLRAIYGIVAAPEPQEFLNAIDYRSSSPSARMRRLYAFATVVTEVIEGTAR